MAKNERAKRKQQEQRSRKREQAKQQAKAQALPTARSALVELATQGSFGPAWVTAGLGDDLAVPEIATVVVTRKLPRGQWLAHLVLVDRTCLGVKDGFLLGPCSQEEVVERVAELGREGNPLERCEPAWAQSIVLHAIDYAASLGFSPHRDFAPPMVLPRPQPLLDTPLRRPSKPLYVEGPHDDRSPILAKLVDAVGWEGFDYVMAPRASRDVDLEDESDDELDDDEPLVITAPRPPRIVPGYDVGPGVFAWTLVRRYVHGMSLEQQAEDLAEQDLPYDVGDLEDWHDELAAACAELLDAMEAEAGGSRVWSESVELDVDGIFTTLIDACVEPRIDPEPYLRDLFYLVREWPVERIVELAPAHWQATVAEEPARGMLERNVLRSATQ